MTTPSYRAIADSEIALDAPIDEALMTALAYNSQALVEGGANAPKLSQANLKPSTGVTSEPAKSSPHQLNSERILHQIIVANGVQNGAGGLEAADIDSQDYTFIRAGTYTLRILTGNSFGSTPEQVGAKVYVQNSLVHTVANAYPAPTTPDYHNITVAAGDTIRLRLTGVSNGSWDYGQAVMTIYTSSQFYENSGVAQYTQYADGSGTTHSYYPQVPTFITIADNL